MFSVSTLAFMYGITVGWPSPVQPVLQSESSPVGKLSDDEISWLASLTFLGGIVGPLFWSRIADRFGRKIGGYLSAGLFLLGYGLTAFTTNRHFLMSARFINGLGASGGMIVAPTYISEIAQDGIRGALGSFVMLNLNAGVVFAYGLGAELSYQQFNLICLAVPLLFLLLFFWLPESPEYLWSKNKLESAEDALHWLRGCNNICVQEETLSFSKKSSAASSNCSSLFSTRGRRMGMLIGIALFAWQQMCGIVPILSYSSFIFQKSGNLIAPERASIIIGVIQLFASFVSSSVVDRCGRKLLLFISYIVMGLALTALGLYYHLDSNNVNVSSVSWIPVFSLSVHVINYALGAGPVPYIVMSEVVPIDIRGLAISVVILWGTLLAFINAKIFPVLIELTGLSGCLWLYAIFSFIGFLFTWSVVPETKGIPLQEILSRLNGYSKSGTP